MRRRSGVALLEALIALAILGIAGVSIVVFAIDAGRTVQRAREADGEIRRAGALFDAVALWPRADLDRHLGSRPQGPWRLRVDRPLPTLYTVVLTDSTEAREILRTSLYRPDPDPKGGEK